MKRTLIFVYVLSRDYYKDILNSIHFTTYNLSSKRSFEENELSARPFKEQLRHFFKPSRNLCIDECSAIQSTTLSYSTYQLNGTALE